MTVWNDRGRLGFRVKGQESNGQRKYKDDGVLFCYAEKRVQVQRQSSCRNRVPVQKTVDRVNAQRTKFAVGRQGQGESSEFKG